MSLGAVADDQSLPQHPALTAALGAGDLQLAGRLVQASNATFLATLTCGDRQTECVYKPIRGERPLWDFPTGTLGRREVAAYEVSRIGGFDVVPVTVLSDGPLGLGSLQAWWSRRVRTPVWSTSSRPGNATTRWAKWSRESTGG